MPDLAHPLAEALQTPTFCAPACIVFGLQNGPRLVLALNGFPGGRATAHTQESLSGFVTGTRMLGRAGIVPVEQLTAGDVLWTMHNGMQPIRWISRRSIPLSADRTAHQPVQLRTDAFARGCPTDPLILLPGHLVHVSDLRLDPSLTALSTFLPAHSLLDDDKVTRVTDMSSLELIHLGLDVSDVVYASGMMVQNPEDVTRQPTRSPDNKVEEFLTCFPGLSGLFRFNKAGSDPSQELPRAKYG
ncbi:MAG: Hint domain-containing protein [Pseudomonadota bacterium]